MRQGPSPRGPRHRDADGSDDLANLARAALVGSTDGRDGFRHACWQYAYAAAIRFGSKHHGAEDSAQDAAIVVDRLLDARPPAIKPETVAALISIVVLRSVRATAQRRIRETNVAEPTVTAHDTAGCHLEMETAERARSVLDAVDKLPQLLRRMVNLRYWDDLSSRAIARQLGTSHTSIVRLLRKAEDILRVELREFDGADDERADTTPASDRLRDVRHPSTA